MLLHCLQSAAGIHRPGVSITYSTPRDRAVAGMGVTGIIDGKRTSIGNKNLLLAEGVKVDDDFVQAVTDTWGAKGVASSDTPFYRILVLRHKTMYCPGQFLLLDRCESSCT